MLVSFNTRQRERGGGGEREEEKGEINEAAACTRGHDNCEMQYEVP